MPVRRFYNAMCLLGQFNEKSEGINTKVSLINPFLDQIPILGTYANSADPA